MNNKKIVGHLMARRLTIEAKAVIQRTLQYRAISSEAWKALELQDSSKRASMNDNYDEKLKSWIVIHTHKYMLAMHDSVYQHRWHFRIGYEKEFVVISDKNKSIWKLFPKSYDSRDDTYTRVLSALGEVALGAHHIYLTTRERSRLNRFFAVLGYALK